jgi:hypothetical protein
MAIQTMRLSRSTAPETFHIVYPELLKAINGIEPVRLYRI